MDNLLRHSGGSVFALARIAMLRALELEAGKPSLITNASTDKPTTTALEEIAQGKVSIKKKPKTVKEEGSNGG